jgi:hypothetical protein
MKKNIFSVLSVLLVVIILATPVAAGGGIKLSGFRLGSLIADGSAFGLGNTDWLIQLEASGHASVICTNPGKNPVPGQSSPHVDDTGVQEIPKDSLTKNGKAPFSVKTTPEEELNPLITWQEGGCPNSKWTAKIDFVFWDHAIVSLIDPATGVVASMLEFNCVTKRTGPNSTPSTFDDGTVSCTQVN